MSGAPPGDVIATRTLQRAGRTYEVRVGRPVPDEGGGWRCPWQLVDDAGTVVVAMSTGGADSAQALTLALVMIGDRVAAEHADFTWEGLPGTGFPRHHRVDGAVSGLWEQDGFASAAPGAGDPRPDVAAQPRTGGWPRTRRLG